MRSAFDLARRATRGDRGALKRSFRRTSQARFETAPDLIGGIEIAATARKSPGASRTISQLWKTASVGFVAKEQKPQSRPSRSLIARHHSNAPDDRDRRIGFGTYSTMPLPSERRAGSLHAGAGAARNRHDRQRHHGRRQSFGPPGRGLRGIDQVSRRRARHRLQC